MKKIGTIPVLKIFNSHIDDEDNKRIIFSGEYGSGKTSFLKEYFETKKDKYNTFWQSPIKYSVASNEDVMEYIKFHIIVDLLQNHLIPQKKIELPEGLFIWSYINNNFSQLIDSFLNGVTLIKPQTAILKKSVELVKLNYKKYVDYKKELNSKMKSDNEVLLDYIDIGINKKGSIFEDDLITQTIRFYLELICEGSDDNEEATKVKENVLIIDDLDRLDPDHIFRILNVFSVHNDYLRGEYNNKFGFDKIIIVCDIDSVKNYYIHKYGIKSNFSGYIDKFCSKKYFRFSINQYIKAYCQKELIITSIEKHCVNTLSIVLTDLIAKKQITLRNLVKHNYMQPTEDIELGDNLSFDIDRYCSSCRFVESNELILSNKHFPFLKAISILITVVGDFEKLVNIISKNTEDESVVSEKMNLNDITSSLCLLSHYSKHSDNIEKLCFSIMANPHPGNLKHFDHPTAYFLESNVKIELNWSKIKDNRYQGNQPYFQNCKIHNGSILNKSIKMGLIYKEILQILYYLKKSNFQNKF